MPSDFSIEEATRTVLLLSQERLRPFRDPVESDIEEIKLHKAAKRLNAAPMALAATTEIAPRNAVHSLLSSTLTTEDWLRNPPRPVAWRKGEHYLIRKAERKSRKAARVAPPLPPFVPPRPNHQDADPALLEAAVFTGLQANAPETDQLRVSQQGMHARSHGGGSRGPPQVAQPPCAP